MTDYFLGRVFVLLLVIAVVVLCIAAGPIGWIVLGILVAIAFSKSDYSGTDLN